MRCEPSSVDYRLLPVKTQKAEALSRFRPAQLECVAAVLLDGDDALHAELEVRRAMHLVLAGLDAAQGQGVALVRLGLEGALEIRRARGHVGPKLRLDVVRDVRRVESEV